MDLNRKMTLYGSVLGLAAAGAVARAENLTIRGKTFEIWPVADLARRGFDVQEVPKAENAAWIYLDAINAYPELPESLNAVLDYAAETAWPADQPALREYLFDPGTRTALERCFQAARTDKCQFPVCGDPRGSVLSTILPPFAHVRTIAKLLVAEGRRLAAEGKPNAALDHFLTAMRMGGHVAQGMTLIEGLVGIAVWAQGQRAMVDQLLRWEASAVELEGLLDRLNQIAAHMPSMERSLRYERALGPAVVDESCSRPFRFDWTLSLAGSKDGLSLPDTGDVRSVPDAEDGWGRLELRIGRLLLPDRAIKRHMNEYHENVVAAGLREGWTQARQEAEQTRFIHETIPKWDVISRTVLPTLSRAATLGRRLEAEFALARTVLAIRLYQTENDGTPPADLSEIASRLPEGALTDPFSPGSSREEGPNGGRAAARDLLRYRRTDAGWLLYSVSANAADDGGRRGRTFDEWDIVVTFPPPAIEPFRPKGE
jgi:hypothetical protein